MSDNFLDIDKEQQFQSILRNIQESSEYAET